MKSASFVVTAVFPAKISVLYRAFLDDKTHSDFTGSEAHIEDRVGGKFSAWDGYITGEIVVLEENRRITQKWRTANFADTDRDSILDIEFAESGDETVLTLRHSNLPDGTEEEYRQGWEDYYIAPLKEFLDALPAK
jgi:activator of HSP90 ATPase